MPTSQLLNFPSKLKPGIYKWKQCIKFKILRGLGMGKHNRGRKRERNGPYIAINLDPTFRTLELSSASSDIGMFSKSLSSWNRKAATKKLTWKRRHHKWTIPQVTLCRLRTFEWEVCWSLQSLHQNLLLICFSLEPASMRHNKWHAHELETQIKFLPTWRAILMVHYNKYTWV